MVKKRTWRSHFRGVWMDSSSEARLGLLPVELSLVTLSNWGGWDTHIPPGNGVFVWCLYPKNSFGPLWLLNVTLMGFLSFCECSRNTIQQNVTDVLVYTLMAEQVLQIPQELLIQTIWLLCSCTTGRRFSMSFLVQLEENVYCTAMNLWIWSCSSAFLSKVTTVI